MNKRPLLGRTGCFVSSAAMILSSFGHNVNPSTLNNFLINHASPENGEFPWINFNSSLGNNFNYGQTDLIRGPAIRWRDIRVSTISLLEEKISLYGPVLLRVPSANKSGTGYVGFTEGHSHAVVAYAFGSNNEILIRDPATWDINHQQDLRTLGDYIVYANSRLSNDYHIPSGYSWLGDQILTYAETLTPRSSQIIQGTGNSPVEFIIIDPRGRKLGFDPIQGLLFNEIPDSCYSRETIAAPVEGAFDEIHKFLPIVFTIGDLVTGSYKLDVFGIGDGKWSINANDN